MSNVPKVEREIGRLADLPRPELVERWKRIYRCPPPRGVKRGLLERAIAWHLQAKHFGGFSPAIKRRLAEAAVNGSGLAARSSDAPDKPKPFVPTTTAAPGTRLIHNWHGRNHSVDVIEEGFVFEGRTYSSLSAIAREITGARWSGPRFFNL
jgi:Protein of unknown function (DUF2924)